MRTISQPAARQPLDLVDGARVSSVSVVVIDWTRIGFVAADADVADAHLARRRGAAARRDRPEKGRLTRRPSPAPAARRRSKASSTLPGSRPPAWAKSGRPPPLPPTTAAISRIRSPAWKRSVEVRRHAEREGHLVRRRAPRAARCRCRAARAARRPSRAARRRRRRPTFAASTLHAADLLDLRARGRPTPRGAARARSALELALEGAALLEQLLDARLELADRRAQQLRGALERALLLAPARAAPRRRSAPRCAARRRRCRLSATILSRPMSPVARAWVPPHSSFEKSPKLTTRTRSPYFSPNIAIAPGCDRLAVGQLLDDAPARSRAIQPFTRSSIASSCSRVTRRVVGEVEAQAVRASTSEPRCVALRAEHLAQRRVQQVRARVVAHGRRRACSESTAQPRRLVDVHLAAHHACRGARSSPPAGAACRRPSTRPVGGLDRAAVADLAAALGVEGRLLDDDLDRVARRAPAARAAPSTTSAEHARVDRERRRSRRKRGLEVGGELRRRPARRAASPLPFQAARARSRCASIAASKPVWSRRRPLAGAGCPRSGRPGSRRCRRAGRRRRRRSVRRPARLRAARSRPRAARGPSRASRGSAPPRGGRGP